jgi:hypothetical protein
MDEKIMQKFSLRCQKGGIKRVLLLTQLHIVADKPLQKAARIVTLQPDKRTLGKVAGFYQCMRPYGKIKRSLARSAIIADAHEFRAVLTYAKNIVHQGQSG